MEDRGKLAAVLNPFLDHGGEGLGVPLLARPETGEVYTFNLALSGQQFSKYAHPEKVIAGYDRDENEGGRLVAFLDGHHIWATREQWERLRGAEINAARIRE